MASYSDKSMVAEVEVGDVEVGDVDVKDPCKGTQTNDIKVTLDGETVSVDSSVLPTGAATSANQVVQIAAEQAVQSLLEGAWTVDTASVSAGSSGDNTLISSPGVSKQLWIHKLYLVVARNNEVDMTLKSGSTAKSGTMPLDVLFLDLDNFPIKCGTNEAFVLNLSSAVDVTGIVIYRTVDV